MKIVKFIFTAVILFTLLINLDAQTKPVDKNYFESDTWPGEGIPVINAKHAELILHEEPSFESSIIRIPFEKGKTINFDKSRMITKQSVILTAKKKITQFYCSGKSKLEINPGDKIEYLQYRAEGYATCRLKGEICEVFIMDNEPAFDGLDKKPIVEWWVRVINHDKKPVGWLVVDYNEFNQIEFGERKF